MEAAGETRARVALAAAEGDPAALAELEAATAAATWAVLGGQNVELALAGARARLAELRARAERERPARRRSSERRPSGRAPSAHIRGGGALACSPRPAPRGRTPPAGRAAIA